MAAKGGHIDFMFLAYPSPHPAAGSDTAVHWLMQKVLSVEDQRYPKEDANPSRGRGHQPINWHNFHLKLHENKIIWTKGAHP